MASTKKHSLLTKTGLHFSVLGRVSEEVLLACSPDHCLDPEQCSHEELKLPTKKIKIQNCLVYGLTDLSAANNRGKKRREKRKTAIRDW